MELQHILMKSNYFVDGFVLLRSGTSVEVMPSRTDGVRPPLLTRVLDSVVIGWRAGAEKFPDLRPRRLAKFGLPPFFLLSDALVTLVRHHRLELGLVCLPLLHAAEVLCPPPNGAEPPTPPLRFHVPQCRLWNRDICPAS